MAQTHPELEFIFRHALIQDMAYESLLFADRKRLHQKVGETLKRLYPDQLDELAATLTHHYTQTGDDEQAAIYLRRAGDQARRLIAVDDATRFYRAALELWPASDKTSRAEMLYKLGECLWVTDDEQESLEALKAAYSLLTTSIELG